MDRDALTIGNEMSSQIIQCPECGGPGGKSYGVWTSPCDECEARSQVPCPECGGPGGYRFGVTTAACEPCATTIIVREAARKRQAEINRWASDLGEKYSQATPDGVPTQLSPALRSEAPRIGMTGPARAGKSCAMACIVLAVPLQRYAWVATTRLRQTSLDARQGEAEERNEARRMLGIWARVPLLCLDDLHQVTYSEAFCEALFELLETRERDGRRTLWTSNRSLAELHGKIARESKDGHRADAICGRLAQDALIIEL